MLYFIVQHGYTVLLLICWFYVGGLITSALKFERMDSQRCRKQTELVVIVRCYSPSLLPNQWEMNGVKEFVVQTLIFSMQDSEWL